MEFEIINYEKFETGNKKLDTNLNAILTAYKNFDKASESVAKALYTIREGKLWENTQYNSFAEVSAVFNIGKQQAYKLANAYKLKYYEDSLTERLSPFKIAQIIEFMTLEVTDIMVLIDEASIAPTMSCARIRDVVSNYKKSLEVGDDLTDESEGESNESESESESTDFSGVRVMYNGVELDVTADKVQTAIIKLLYKYHILEESEVVDNE